LNFQAQILAEPVLEFGGRGGHIDPRVGLMEFGPLQPVPGDRIKIGVIGTGATVDGFEKFLERCKAGIPGKPSPLINLHPGFPGMGNTNPFRCVFETDGSMQRRIPQSDIRKIAALPKQSDAIKAAAELFGDQARALLEGSSRPDVVVAALPVELIQKIVNARAVDESEEDDVDADAPLDFRDLFKSQALLLNVPTQIVWPTLWDDDAKIPRKIRNTMRTVQDPATRAWNLLNALFYKAGKAPWRLPRKEGELAVSFLGIGFYRDLDGQRLLTSTAQMFDERGRGLILRGAKARTDRGDRHPYLERADAYDLVTRSVKAFRAEHLHPPARLVIMKTSRFEKVEAEGMLAAADELEIPHRDLVWVSEGGHQTLVREGDYPPLRGTSVQIGQDLMLFTRGSVPYYRTYPGMRVPRPLLLRPFSCDTPIGELGAEVLALTKMNWNTTQFDQALPIPIRAARQVGRILKYVSYGQLERSDYRYYI
jgi:hypothetical protein